MLILLDLIGKTKVDRLKLALVFLDQNMSIWYFNEHEIFLN